MINMVYTSCKKQIVFDDYVDEVKEYNAYYVEVCEHCRNKHKDILATRVDDSGSPWGTCFVKGCNNEADYYVDFNKDEVEFFDEADNGYYEAVEVCPHCDSENVYPMWDTEILGFVAVCKHCGKEILLCDECQHTILQDGEVHDCDWCKTECGGKCQRGCTKD